MYIHICLQWGFRIAIAGPRDNMDEYESVSASIFHALGLTNPLQTSVVFSMDPFDVQKPLFFPMVFHGLPIFPMGFPIFPMVSHGFPLAFPMGKLVVGPRLPLEEALAWWRREFLRDVTVTQVSHPKTGWKTGWIHGAGDEIKTIQELIMVY